MTKDIVVYDENLDRIAVQWRVWDQDVREAEENMRRQYPDCIVEVEPHDDEAERREMLEIPEFLRRKM